MAVMNTNLDIHQSALLTDLAMCLNSYRLFTPGLYCCVQAAVELADGVRLSPGITVMVNHGRMKQCEPAEDGDCFRGPPNFVLDVFPQGDWQDYETRRAAYERHGVLEYVAVRQGEFVEWRWNHLSDGKYKLLEAAEQDLIKSRALPGLWIPTTALQHRDWWAVMAAIAQGVTRVEHHDFMTAIWDSGKKPS